MAPPKIVNFPTETTVKICFRSGQIVHGHSGFRAELKETVETDWITSPNYPDVINSDNFMDRPNKGYAAGISQCWVRSPSKGHNLELNFYQFDVSFTV